MTVAAPEKRPSRQALHAARKAAGAREVATPLRRLDPDRWQSCRLDLRAFCERYLPDAVPLAWSPDHILVLEGIQRAVLEAGRQAIAMPRGSGKTTLISAGALWAVLYGHCSMITIVGADKPSAEKVLDAIVTDIETNEAIISDYPEVCLPVRAMDGIHQRATGQTWHGRRTLMQWTSGRVILPTVHCHECDDGSMGAEVGKEYPSSGAIIDAVGITGRIRGRLHKLGNGRIIRPDLVLIDDPQTDQSARSPSQVQRRLTTMRGAILGLAGPKKRVAALAAVTVITPDDMADQILDADKSPTWGGIRCKMVYAWPTGEEAKQLWDEYAEKRKESLATRHDLSLATAFYQQHRKEMDHGARVGWEQRYNDDEVSALQHAYNLRLDNEQIFNAEYQNEPIDEAQTDETQLTRDLVMSRVNRLPIRVARQDASKLIIGMDVQQKVLYWTALACDQEMTGNVVDYGTWPKQRATYYTLRDIRRSLAKLYPGRTEDDRIILGIHALADDILRREWRNENGDPLKVGSIVVDSGNWTDAVYEACRTYHIKGLLLPYKGFGIGAKNRPMEDIKTQRGDRRGPGWRIPAKPPGGRSMGRLLNVDTNAWKWRLVQALTREPTEIESISFYGSEPTDHEMIADHICAEYFVKTEGRGRSVREFALRPGAPDNHLLDAVIMAMVGASVEGAGLVVRAAEPRAERVSFAELQRQKRDRKD